MRTTIQNFQEGRAMTQTFTLHLICPWCSKGENLADGRASAIVSAQCPRCKHFFRADLNSLKTERAQPQRRLGQNTAD